MCRIVSSNLPGSGSGSDTDSFMFFRTTSGSLCRLHDITLTELKVIDSEGEGGVMWWEGCGTVLCCAANVLGTLICLTMRTEPEVKT